MTHGISLAIGVSAEVERCGNELHYAQLRHTYHHTYATNLYPRDPILPLPLDDTRVDTRPTPSPHPPKLTTVFRNATRILEGL